MKYALYLCSLFLFFNYYAAMGQIPTLQKKLYYSCKVWGFVKYFHSNVSTCGVNWDSVLLANLPIIEAAGTENEFNNALDSMLSSAGPMALAATYFPDTLPAELKRNRDFGWLSDTIFRSDVRTILDTIKNNFRPHPECWVQLNSSGFGIFGTSGGELRFPYDSILLNINTYATYPDKYERLLMLFKFWNMVNYFNPYNYVLDNPIDTVLFNSVLKFDTASNANLLYEDVLNVTAALNSAHVEGLTYSDNLTYPNEYVPKLLIEYIQGKYVVVKSGISGINVGSVILAIQGKTTSQWEDSLSLQVSAGNSSVFRRFISEFILWGGSATNVAISYMDTLGGTHDTSIARDILFGDPSWFPQYYYPNDSLNSIHWTTMGCDIGYLNIGNMTIADIDSAYLHLHNAPAIIVDLRNYPLTTSVWELAELMYPSKQCVAQLMMPDVTYPGTYGLYLDSFGINGNTNPYLGTVILLFNETTQSAAEFDCMILSKMPHIIKIGSQTAGADGGVTFFQLTKDIHSGFSSEAVFYPNGDSTERIGILPDSLITPSIAGVIARNDEVLNKALQVACALGGTNEIKSISDSINIYPNPALDKLIVSNIRQKTTYRLLSCNGDCLQQGTLAHGDCVILLANITPGFYIIEIDGLNESKQFFKLVKE